MRKILILLMLFISVIINGQYQLKGNIKDYQDETNLMGTSALIFSLSDSSYKTQANPFEEKTYNYLNGAVSRKNGNFLIDSISIKKCNVLISLIGYEKLLIKNIILSKKDTIDLGSIYLFRTSTVAGFDEYYPSDIEEIRQLNKRKFTITYPKHTKKLKMEIKGDIVTITYKELLKNKTTANKPQ